MRLLKREQGSGSRYWLAVVPLLAWLIAYGLLPAPTGHAQALRHTTNALTVTTPAPSQAQPANGLKRRLAPTSHVLASLAPTTIVQFPLVPSGLKKNFPTATGLVTIVRGSRDNSVADNVTIDVRDMPPNITFTIFLIEIANKPFGNVEYVADLTTRGDGTGETVFDVIALVAFAMDSNNPGTSQEKTEGLASGTQLEHLGMWFSSLTDAQTVLGDSTLKGTIFDGGNPPLHAGPQAMTDGQTAPVF